MGMLQWGMMGTEELDSLLTSHLKMCSGEPQSIVVSAEHYANSRLDC